MQMQKKKKKMAENFNSTKIFSNQNWILWGPKIDKKDVKELTDQMNSKVHKHDI